MKVVLYPVDIVMASNLVKSRTEAKKLILQGAVEITPILNGEYIFVKIGKKRISVVKVNLEAQGTDG